LAKYKPNPKFSFKIKSVKRLIPIPPILTKLNFKNLKKIFSGLLLSLKVHLLFKIKLEITEISTANAADKR